MSDLTHSHKNIFLFLFWTFLHLFASLVNSPRGVVCPFVLRHFHFAITEEDFVDYDGCYYDDNGCQNDDDEDDKDNYQVKVTLTVPL